MQPLSLGQNYADVWLAFVAIWVTLETILSQGTPCQMIFSGIQKNA